MNAKIYTGNVQPNPKEYKVWVNDEGVIKTYNGETWVEQSGASSGDGDGNGSGNEGENKFGMIYLSKAAFFEAIGMEMPDDMSSEEFSQIALGLITSFGCVIFRETNINNVPSGFVGFNFVEEEIAENRFKYKYWDAVALNLDNITAGRDSKDIYKLWNSIAQTNDIAEAKNIINQAFSNQMSEDEFMTLY